VIEDDNGVVMLTMEAADHRTEPASEAQSGRMSIKEEMLSEPDLPALAALLLAVTEAQALGSRAR
jgi:hypothetical protein